MDLDTMKSNWDALNDRLEHSVTVNADAIKRLLSQKAVESYDKVRNQMRVSLYSSIFLVIIFPIQYVQGIIPYWYSLAIMELFVAGSLFYTISLLRAIPQSGLSKDGVVQMIKNTARFQRMYVMFSPIFLTAIVITLAIFFISVGNGFPDDNYHLALLIGTIVFVTACGIIGYRKTKKQLKEIDTNLKELQKFEQE